MDTDFLLAQKETKGTKIENRLRSLCLLAIYRSLLLLIFLFSVFFAVTSSVFQSVSVFAPCFANRTPKSAAPVCPIRTLAFGL
jgi:hypothetical protein